VQALGTAPDCYPRWHADFAPLAAEPQITVFSGCGVDALGNVACAPEVMRARAEAQLQRIAPRLFRGPLSLETYTLARYMQSEVGDGTIEERVAVGEAAVNRARRERLRRGVLDLLLYRQLPGHPNYGFYGPIHDRPEGCAARGLPKFCAPFGRWASTAKDPTVLTLLLADLVMSNRSGNFARGADDQVGLEYKETFSDPAAYVRAKAAQGSYWVGPLPGVDHWRTFLTRELNIEPSTPIGAALLAQGLAAVSSRKAPPVALPICPVSENRRVARALLAIVGLAGAAGLSWLAIRGSV
jgi:hypothetical protein